MQRIFFAGKLLQDDFTYVHGKQMCILQYSQDVDISYQYKLHAEA